jgi:hypothetical protein
VHLEFHCEHGFVVVHLAFFCLSGDSEISPLELDGMGLHASIANTSNHRSNGILGGPYNYYSLSGCVSVAFAPR